MRCILKPGPVSLLAALSLTLFFIFHPRAEEKTPTELQGIGIDSKLGAMIPLNLTFNNEEGRPVQLGSYFSAGRPVVLTLVYYECPMLCTLVLNNLVDTLKKLDWTPGQQFEIVSVSINPAETPELAKAKKDVYLGVYGKPQAAAGWHFLTGKEPQIKALADAVGFKYRWDPEQKQFAHGTGIFVLTAKGKLSQTLYGIDYPAKTLRLSLVQASEGQIGSALDRLVLFCYHYDPKTGHYTPMVMRIMQIAGVLTVLALALIIGIFLRRDRRRRAAAIPAPTRPGTGPEPAAGSAASRAEPSAENKPGDSPHRNTLDGQGQG